MTDIPETLKDNPLLKDWSKTGLPDFAAIRTEHFEPALRFGMAAEKDEIKAITKQRSKPTFENTILAFERVGDVLARVNSVFNMLSGLLSDEAMQKVEERMSGPLSLHSSWVFQNKALFKRVDAVHQQRDTLPPIQRRLTEVVHKAFVDSGAALPPEARKRLAKLQAQEAKLGAKFDANLVREANRPALLLNGTERDLAGLPQFVRDAAAEKARELGKPGKYAFVPSGPMTHDLFLPYSSRRDLREKLFKAWAARNDNSNRFDNKAIGNQLLGLSAEIAGMLGQPTPAALYLKDNMVGTPERAEQLLHESWRATVPAYLRERAMLQEAMQKDGINEPLQPWDWRYYARQLREEKLNLSDDEVKPYLSLDNVLEATFATASKLWGLQFSEVKGAALYHPDARLWDVRDASGAPVGRFIGDYFGRSTKKPGAWMNELQTQYFMDGGQQPVVYNICNFSKAPAGQPTLLSLDEAKTVFHEFGHGLHGLLSQVEFPTLAGCNGPPDYVELPSQLFEKFLLTPPIMQYLRHSSTGEVMPDALAQRIRASDNFTVGHEMMEYLTSAVVDLELHRLQDASQIDLPKFEQETLARWQAPEGHYMRHRLPHFSHVFGGGYSSAYHSYEYAAMLDSDGFDAFTEKGDPFHQPTAAALRHEIYASGASRKPIESYVAFRGREPQMAALFKSRNLTPA